MSPYPFTQPLRRPIKKLGLLEKTHHKRSSQYLSALAKKVKKKRLQPVEVAAVL